MVKEIPPILKAEGHSRQETTVQFHVRPVGVWHAMLVGISILALLHVAVLSFASLRSISQTVVEMADLDNEKSLATLFVVGQWLLATFLLYRLMRCRSCAGTKYQWASLVAVFAFLTMDEFCSLHEKLSKVIHGALNTGGVFVYVWFVPYLFIAAVMAFMLSGLWKRLPRLTKRAFLLSGFVFLAGSVGIEMFEGMYADKHGPDLVYSLAFVAPEETLEMIGLAIFVNALLNLLSDGKAELRPE